MFRVWHYLVRVITPLLMVGMALFILGPQNPILQAMLLVCMALFTLPAIVGGVMGILLAMGKLKMACPFCKAKGQIFTEDRAMLLLCPACGIVRETGFLRLRLEAEPTSTDTESSGDELEDDGPLPMFPAGFVYFRRWKTLGWFVLLMLPVLAGVAILVMREKFVTAAALLVLHGMLTAVLFVILCSGDASSTAGNFDRQKSPVRYWLTVALIAFWYGVCLSIELSAKGDHAL